MATKKKTDAPIEDIPSIDELLGPAPVVESKTVKTSSTAKKEKTGTSTRMSSKGKMVSFKNQKGETICGMGTIYYVVRFEGKLHYKEESSVTVLPEGWKEGDAIPGAEEENLAS